ncbi:MAG: CcmD family protein [Ktedonobacterales bacterium]|nr:CcmD family protein [Ktedonobacterales bacterium]
MQNASYVVAAYALIWLGVLAYVGWLALRMRGVRTELETVRELVEERDGEAFPDER